MPLLILVVDDNLGLRLATSDYLELSGYSAIMAGDGEEALSLLETYHPHLIVADIKMPRKDGYELVKQVRQRPQFRLLPVIFLTECNSTEERIRGYQAGCDVYLPKPFAMEELGAIVRNLLERVQVVQSEWRFPPTSIPTPPEIPPSLSLTPREREVLNFITDGNSNIDIGQKLHLSPRTVEKYVSGLLRKTDTSNRAELVRFALENHLVHT